MKKLFTILTMVGCGFAAHGKAVDENTARTVGGNFLISAGVAGVKGASDIALAYTATEVVNGGVVSDYYVFNIVGNKGFVMVAGDDNVIPILAYSNKSKTDSCGDCAQYSRKTKHYTTLAGTGKRRYKGGCENHSNRCITIAGYYVGPIA